MDYSILYSYFECLHWLECLKCPSVHCNAIQNLILVYTYYISIQTHEPCFSCTTDSTSWIWLFVLDAVLQQEMLQGSSIAECLFTCIRKIEVRLHRRAEKKLWTPVNLPGKLLIFQISKTYNCDMVYMYILWWFVEDSWFSVCFTLKAARKAQTPISAFKMSSHNFRPWNTKSWQKGVSKYPNKFKKYIQYI